MTVDNSVSLACYPEDCLFLWMTYESLHLFGIHVQDQIPTIQVVAEMANNAKSKIHPPFHKRGEVPKSSFLNPLSFKFLPNDTHDPDNYDNANRLSYL